MWHSWSVARVHNYCLVYNRVLAEDVGRSQLLQLWKHNGSRKMEHWSVCLYRISWTATGTVRTNSSFSFSAVLSRVSKRQLCIARYCPSVRPSVRLSVCLSVCDLYPCDAMLARVLAVVVCLSVRFVCLCLIFLTQFCNECAVHCWNIMSVKYPDKKLSYRRQIRATLSINYWSSTFSNCHVLFGYLHSFIHASLQ